MLDAETHNKITLQSTSLIRGKTIFTAKSIARVALQSTSLIRGKTDQIFRIGVGLFTSIHFPHPREDSSMLQGVYGFETSIHFPHPREDSGQKRNLLVQRHFNPLPSSEGRRDPLVIRIADHATSIHFPHPREDSKTS